MRIEPGLLHELIIVLPSDHVPLEDIQRARAGQAMQVRPHVLDVELPAIPPGEVQLAQVDGHLVVVLVEEDLHLLGQLDGRQVAARHLGLVGRRRVLVDGEDGYLAVRAGGVEHVPDLLVRRLVLGQGHDLQSHLLGRRRRRSRFWSFGGRSWWLGGLGCFGPPTGRQGYTRRGHGADAQKVAPTQLVLFHVSLLFMVSNQLPQPAYCSFPDSTSPPSQCG